MAKEILYLFSFSLSRTVNSGIFRELTCSKFDAWLKLKEAALIKDNAM